MSDKRETRSAVLNVELVLTLLAVIAGSIAATGAFLGASYERDRIALEKRPAVLLSCEPEFHTLDTAEGTRPPTNTVLLTPRGARWIHIVSDGRGDTPQPFARCALTSYGELPVFNLRVALKLEMLDSPSKGPNMVDSSFDVPGLSPSQPYPFGLINGTHTNIRLNFDRAMTLTLVDSGTATVETLFLDHGLLNLQQQRVPPAEAVAVPGTMGPSTNGSVVRVRDFLYAPGSLYVRKNQTVTFINDDAEAHAVTGPAGSFDSGTIDPQAKWRHSFSQPGVYYYRCSFHPYMRGRIVVSE
ncbi:MAG TPA: cupredoxin family copper-binding protein [Candidatus Cybelea sp.]|jgi:plastocyanin